MKKLILLLALYIISYQLSWPSFAYILSPKVAFAQAFSLSVSPPLTQILIKPGTKVTQTYQFANNGEGGLYSIHLFPFSPGGINGEIDLDENAPNSDWFSLLAPQIAFGTKFNASPGSNTTVVLQISVPPGAVQKDYYFSLVFQSENEKGLAQSASQSSGRIGSNLLISVAGDENPFKIAEIQEFSAPLIIDSLGKINYSFILKNVGRTLFKPIGRVTVDNFLSRKKTNLEIAPQNVLAYSERKISCLKEESLTDCNLDSPVLFGLYRAKLDFTLDGQSKIYQAEVVTIALPFSLMAVLIVIYLILTTILNKIRVKNTHYSNIVNK